MSPRFTYKNPTKFIFNDDKTCDVKFTFPDENEVVHAHSNILYIECPKLYSLVRGTVHGGCLIEIKDKSVEAFREFLRFIYTNDCSLEFERFTELLVLANRFNVPELRKYLSDAVNRIGVDNVLDLFQFCLHNDEYKDVEDKVVDYVSTNFVKILKSTKFESINRELMYAILKLDSKDHTFRSEIEVFDAVQRHLAAKKSGLGLGELVTLIRFPTMTMKEFTTCLSKGVTLLSSEESLSIIMEINEGICNKFGFSNKKRCGNNLSLVRKSNALDGHGQLQSNSIDIVIAPTVYGNTVWYSDCSGEISLQPKQALDLEKIEIHSFTGSNMLRTSAKTTVASFTLTVTITTDSMFMPESLFNMTCTPYDSTILTTTNVKLNANEKYKMFILIREGAFVLPSNVTGRNMQLVRNRPSIKIDSPYIDIISKNPCLKSITICPK